MAVAGVRVALTLLVCVVGGQALDLLRVTAASGDPLPTPTVHCRCAVYPNLTLCSWPEPSPSTPTRYITTCSERHRQWVIHQCLLIQPDSASSDPTPASSPSSDGIQHCRLPNLKLLTDYIINVTAVSPAGSSSHLSSFMLEDIVKPDPPVDVRVSPRDNRTLFMEWSPPPTWANLDIFPLKYQILYHWVNKGITKSVNLGPFESTKFELKSLKPGRTYHFQVCAKELLGLGKCSDWSSPVEITVPATKA